MRTIASKYSEHRGQAIHKLFEDYDRKRINEGKNFNEKGFLNNLNDKKDGISGYLSYFEGALNRKGRHSKFF